MRLLIQMDENEIESKVQSRSVPLCLQLFNKEKYKIIRHLTKSLLIKAISKPLFVQPTSQLSKMPRGKKTKEETTEQVEAETTSPKKAVKKKAEKSGDADGEPAEEKSKLRKESSLTKGMDFSHTCQTKDGRSPNWKIASWNVNGIRAWMDETKCATEDIPSDVKVPGYYDYWSSAEKAGYAGTAIYSKTEPIKITYGLGIPKHDDEGRVITAEFDKFYLVTSYVPNAGRGLPRLPYRAKEWDVDFRNYLNNLNKTKPVVMCGDLNVAHEEIDIANPKTNKKSAGFTAEERQGFTDLLAEGYIDSFRELYPEEKGARLDYFVLSEKLRDDLCDNVIRKDVMGSDHCPIVLYMAFK
ncbi:APEX1-like protein [Mya arenaria]|uniref:DNA-(apurinic or apyrimidinic site) endonuclease n=1 Tax=Mya arenaria TaxID=6604 RepID=A0ABY7EDB5_MYAAR|nr:APEX1-like protein [Mya arenaria]